MKLIAITLALVFSSTTFAETTEKYSLEYKVASIDAGRPLENGDTSIARVKMLLDTAEKVYKTPQNMLVDSAAVVKNIAKDEQQLDLTIAELLEWSLVSCDVECTRGQFVDQIVRYMTTRATTGQTHYEAMHGLLILNYINKTLSK